MKYFEKDIVYDRSEQPFCQAAQIPVNLSEATMEEHYQKTLKSMNNHNIDVLVIYADREHGSNFCYLTGFVPRFEEAIAVLHKDGNCVLMLGNEMLGMNRYSRIPSNALHVPYFSLPNQPMMQEKDLKGLFKSAGIQAGMKIGIVGWKLFTSSLDNNEYLFDVPHFIVTALQKIVGSLQNVRNMTGLFINPDDGIRVTVNANEIAHYEFGASLAAKCVLNGMNQIGLDKTELEIAQNLAVYGQPVTVQTICATGERFTDALVAPRFKHIKMGDCFSITMGLQGGLTSRAAYIAKKEQDLPENAKDYLDKVAKPYYAALATWYSTVGLDIKAGELFDVIEEVLPQDCFGWSLNPGHLTSDEEWLSSPIYKNSKTRLKSGMMLQMDIIPSMNGYGKVGAEDGIVLADSDLRNELKCDYPEVWERIQIRRFFMQNELGIQLKEETLPLSGIAGYYRPFLLNKGYALKIRR